MPVYAAPPAPERERIRREHAEWSYKTFGDVGPIGPLKHLSKEALEAAAEPDDLSEWADMQFLLWDAQRRAGITDKQITRAMVEKLEINKSRQWPEPKDGEPRLHIKKHPAPVVPEEITADGIIGMHECGFVEGWNACRTAMLNGDIFRENSISSTNNFREIAETSTNSPVIPDGWIICSERMPEKGAYISAVSKHGEYVAGQVIDDWLDLHDGTSFGLDEVYLWMMLPPLPESPQQ
ncbi:dATP/dGTP pyrophosphohydrolase domain-containing protein [Salmonella enterica subsp. diarizonae serovar 61:c:z35]